MQLCRLFGGQQLAWLLVVAMQGGLPRLWLL